MPLINSTSGELPIALIRHAACAAAAGGIEPAYFNTVISPAILTAARQAPREYPKQARMTPDIAHALIRNRQAACVNLMPNVHSIYRWKGRVCDDGEFLLLIKTRAREFDAVRETIQKMNTYELPEVLSYRVDGSSPAFAAWIRKSTDHRKKPVRGKRVPKKK